jgi:Tfp pilus assembly protein PilP
MVGALVLVGCGGSSVTLEEYLTEANALCADAVERMDAVIAPVFAS